jgi:hypothetical protein
MKVIGIGLNKTGTKSLGASLRILGFNHFRWSPEPFDVYLRQGFSGLLSTQGLPVQQVYPNKTPIG